MGNSSINLIAQKNKQNINTKPTLVIGIVIDQMRPDYIYRYWNRLSPNGFKRILKQGFDCQNTTYNYVPTYTAPGHTSIYTGTTPSVHGIIANDWFVREKNAHTYCTDDDSVKTVGSTSIYGKMSPHNLLTTTITDELTLFSNFKSKVIGLSIKDRSAILPAGHLGTAYWYDSTIGGFISSSYYMNQLPNWVQEFNNKKIAQKYLSNNWQTLFPINTYDEESLPDNNKFEGIEKIETTPTFPHPTAEIAKTDLGIIKFTPYGNTITFDLAKQAIINEKLGKNPTNATDFLAISFSATDYIGHKYGNRSIEIEDAYLKFDRDLSDFLSFLDKNIGTKNLLLFITADHGANEVPKFLTEHNVPAGLFNYKDAINALKTKLFQTYNDSLVSAYTNQQIYLNHNFINAKNLNVTEIQNKIASFLQQFNGVAYCITATDLIHNDYTQINKKMVQNGFYPKRSGDVAIVLEPAWMEYPETGTSHGSSYNYDTHVPLWWYGGLIPNGKTTQIHNITDISATIATILKIPFPNGCTGNPILPITDK